MRIEKIQNNGAVTSVYVRYKSGESFYLMLSSDRHHDSIYSDWDKELEHLKMAKELGAYIIDAGDWFDAMQGKYDPRRSYDNIRPEYCRNDYYDVIVDDAIKFYKEYADRIIVIGKGNHEFGVLKHTNIDIINRFVYGLRHECNANTVAGGYGGWVVFHFEHESGGIRRAVRLKYHHSGYANNAPVTKGIIGVNRQSVFIRNADIVVNGHTHTDYITCVMMEELSQSDKVDLKPTYFIRTPGYKNEYRDGVNGFAVENNFAPNVTGSVLVEIKMTAGLKPSFVVSTLY